jgi:hypothetical protein
MLPRRNHFALLCLLLAACSSGNGGAKTNDSGTGPAADARIVAEAAPDSNLSADAAAPADQAGQADATSKADTTSKNDGAPGSDTIGRSDRGADPGARQDAASASDGAAPADSGRDSTLAPADVAPASTDSGSRADGGVRLDVVSADRPTPPADAAVNDPSNTLYVAPDGNDSYPGSKEQPLASIKKAAGLSQPGTLIYMRAGTYKLSATVTVSAPAGTAQNPIRLWAYPGESVVLDFADAPSISKGLSIDASYWHVKGLIVENSAGRGIQVSTGTGIVIENCETRYNGDMGLVVSNGASQALILNCDSHHNFDSANSGENADGFGAKSNVGTGVIFRNCRSWANSDDGWDLYGAPNAVRFENCWAYKNGDNFKNITGFAGDGNGFKLGKSDGDQAHHVLVNCLAWDNLGGNGYEDNNNTGGLTFYNSVAYKNKGAGFEAINNTNHILQNNIAFQNGKPENILTGSVNSNNSWNGFTVTETDFSSLDDKVAVGPRQADGSLPASDFLHLAPTSGLIDKGVDVKLPFLGVAPDLGAYEVK